MKVTMIGVSGSGKTAYMAGLYDVLGSEGANSSGFHIQPRSTNLDETIFNIGRFSELSINEKGKWPSGTVKTTVWPFTLKFKGRNVSYFDWLDYRGGMLNDLSSGSGNDNIQHLISHVIDSNAIILLVDAFMLTEITDIRHARQVSGARRISELMEAFNNYLPDQELIYVIMLTKADTVAEKWKQNKYKLLIERGLEAFNQVVTITKRNRAWTGAIVPVSVAGEGNVSRTVRRTNNLQAPFEIVDTIIGYFSPSSVDAVLFYCLAKTLAQMRDEADKSIAEKEQILVDALSKIGWFDSIKSKLNGTESAQEIASRVTKERNEDYRVLRQFEPYIDILYDSAMEKVMVIR